MGLIELLPGANDAMPVKEFIRETQRMGRHRYQVGDVTCPEAASSMTFKHAIGAIETLGYVCQRQEGRDKLIARMPRGDNDVDPIPALADRLRTYFSH